MINLKVIGEYKAIHVAEDNEQGRHRKVFHPHQDVSSEDDSIKALAEEHWTDEIKTAWQNKLDADKELIERFQ
mgnify:CR=1 FL=1|tara:strand:+ start:288 stop:506 length:219 start_codon:yes stop_codon:yes gene_type:complete